MKRTNVTREGYEKYHVTTDGRVFNSETGKELKTPLNRGGYKKVVLCKGGEKLHLTVHRLVAECFLDNPSMLPAVNHKNKDRTDNRVENLEWCTHKHNIEHSRCYSSYVISPDNVVYEVYNQMDFAKQHNLTHSCLGRVIRGERASHKGWKRFSI